MLSPISLAAFSAGIVQSGLGQTHPVQRVRAVGPQQPPPTAPAAPLPEAPVARDGGTIPGRMMPRGSLLDLSV